MEDILKQLWDHLAARVTGPMNFRLLLQPLMAAGFAVWSGIKDARAGRSAFLWTTVTDPVQRSVLLREAWKDVGKVFILAMVLDAIYQFIAQSRIYLIELLIVAPTLAFIPYILLRGPVTRLIAMFMRNRSA